MRWPWQKKQNPPVRRRSYAGAQLNRLTGEWIAMSTSADTEIRTNLTRLRARSRQLGRDNDYAKAAFRDIEINVVGQGVKLQAQLTQQRGQKLNAPLNASIESAWCRWKRKQFCDTAGKLSFADIERLCMRSIAQDGEILIRKVFQSFGGSKVPLALEMLEADLLDENYNDTAPVTGNQIRMGVEIDVWKRPIAYWFFKKHPGDYSFGNDVSVRGHDRVRIPAEEIIHLFIPDRALQNRGVPWLHAALIRMRHMAGYEEAEIVGARASAALMGFIETPEGQLYGDDVDDGQQVTEFEPGVFKQMNPGEKVNVPSLSRPGGQFDPFMRLMLRGVASSIGVTYESLSADFSQTNYSSTRQALVSSRDFYKVIQAWLIDNLHQAVFESWLDMANLTGAISIPKFETAGDDIYESIKWQPRGWQWIDPLKEVQANVMAVAAGFKTQTEVISEMGGDYDELMAQRKKEVDQAKASGLSFSTEAPPLAPGKAPTPTGPTPSLPTDSGD
jgi:lambda family phage portal protein